MKQPLLSLCLGLAFLAPLRAHDANEEMAAAAKQFLATLPPEQRAKAAFEMADAERLNWHFIPRERKGIPLRELGPEQRLLAEALLATGLSARGYGKAVSIMSLEPAVARMETAQPGRLARDPELYYVSIFGTPGQGAWGWRMEGHHLALNFTTNGSDAPSMTPSFFGANPAEVRTGPRTGTRVLAAEEDLARALVKSLDATQLKAALIQAEAPKDILNDPKRVEPTKPEGIPHGQLTAPQQAMLLDLIKEYLFRCRTDVAGEELARLQKAGMDKVHFAWAGGLEPGQPHYYRVQGGSFVLEYDNTQGGANHIHCQWRDFDRDFGTDLLKAHLDAQHR